MPATALDVRKLNLWLKTNVPFHARAIRKPHREVIIGADSGRDLAAYSDAIRAEFGDHIARIDAYGHSNYLTLISR